MHDELDPFFSDMDKINRRQATVMVVEDDDSARMALEEFLLTEHIHCFSFSNADDAFCQLNVIKPDLIITDWKMPGTLNGLSFIAEIKKKHEDKIPILFMTSFSDPKIRFESLKARATAFIDKNEPIEIFDEQIKALLHLRTRGCQVNKTDTPYLFKLNLTKPILKYFIQIHHYAKSHIKAEQQLDAMFSDLKNNARINESKLRSLLSRHLTTLPKSYVISYRLYLAMQMLNDFTLQEIAFKLGYKDSSNFSHAFKKKYLLPPLEYKRRYIDATKDYPVK